MICFNIALFSIGQYNFQMRLLKSKRESTDFNENNCTTFRNSQLVQPTTHLILTTPRLPFKQRRNRQNENSSKNTFKINHKKMGAVSNRNLRKPSQTIMTLNKLIQYNASHFAEVIVREIEINQKRGEGNALNEALDLMKQVYNLSEHMYQEVYSYRQVEASINNLNMTVKKLGTSTYIYRTCAFSGFALFQYGSYSLALYYFDRALKSFYDRETQVYYEFERDLQLQLYKFVAKIFLMKNRFNQAKNFAYKFLRKAWVIANTDEEMAAYDLLGKIYMEMQSMSMCRYFHRRMKTGEKENPEIVVMSRQEMEKECREKMDFVCYETINIFVNTDAEFNDILQNHYRMRSLQLAKETGLLDTDNKVVYVYTHHSPNRLLANYHTLQRKLIEAKESKELHFIRPKDCIRLKKLFSNYSSIAHEIIQRLSYSCYTTQLKIKIESPAEQAPPFYQWDRIE